ncbi:unnamed protein product [Cuscuta campestris]|uniref:Uncharacterized protein n=1 Tax=Cuscuta campestris TaxID=132261 RepID=A0A484MQ28_9ASTE|nr:unnamed protein product [Cuscuta campestris]
MTWVIGLTPSFSLFFFFVESKTIIATKFIWPRLWSDQAAAVGTGDASDVQHLLLAMGTDREAENGGRY